MQRVLITAALAVALAGCGGDSGPDCGAVGNRAVELIRAEIRAEPDADARDAMESMLGPLKDGIVNRCRDREWSEKTRRCFMAAETAEAADDCVASSPAGEGAATAPEPD